MANEKMLNTRIQLKYDSFSNWSTNNPTLRAGEVAIAYLTTAGAIAPAEGDTQHPVLFKVGPGRFNDLPWASALAADVHGWAKKTESEFTAWVKSLIKITDIDAYSKAEVDSKLSANSTADQAYADGVAATAKSEAISEAAAHAQGLIEALDVTDTAVTGQYVSAVSEADGKISVTRADLPIYTLTTGSADGTVAFNGADVAVKGLGSAAYTDAKAYDVAGSAATAKSEAIAAAASDTSTKVDALKNGEVKANTDAIDAIKDHDSVDSFADVMTEMAKYQIAGDYATKAEAQGYADAKDSAIAAAKKAGDDAQSDLNNYKTSNNAAVALKASQADLEAEIARAQAAEKANSDAIALLVDSTEGDDTKLNSIKELATWIEEHGGEAAEMAEAISDNADAIAAEVKRAGDEEIRLAGLIGNNAEAIQANADAIAALNSEDGKVAQATRADSAATADSASALDASGIAQVKAIKVDNATQADKATDADKLGGVAADQYATKTYADQAEADAIASANANTTEVLKGYYTKSEADAAFMDSTETGAAIDAKITALNLAATYEPIGAETRAKSYADSLAGNYATAAQGTKADSALQEITTTANGGLKVTNKNHIDIDTDVVFVFNCGTSSTLVD